MWPLPTPAAFLSSKAMSLLQLNHATRHAFWHGNFHNHFVHSIVSAAALGASDDRLQEIWDQQSAYLEKLPSRHSNVTADNWRQFKGAHDFYADFLSILEPAVKDRDISQVLESVLSLPHGQARRRDVANGQSRDVLDAPEVFLPGLISGIVHPLISLGFGVEIGTSATIAEALAMAASAHPNSSEKIVDVVLDKNAALRAKEHWTELGSPQGTSVMALLDAMRQDKVCGRLSGKRSAYR